ncbi:MAG: ribonucleoside-diphosphate reductase subunit alpha [Spirochaetota bacterium]
MQVIKRDGRVQEFDFSRIEKAVEKAYRAAGIETDDTFAEVTESLRERIENEYQDRSPEVEELQDLVERSLVEHKLYEISKRYILYREERSRHRETRRQEILKRANLGEISVTKRSGTTESFSFDKIIDTIHRLAGGENTEIAVDLIIKELGRNIFDGISTVDLERALLLAVTSFIERDPAYDTLASKLYKQRLYHEVFGASVSDLDRPDAYRWSFKKGIARGVEEGMFSSTLLDFDLDLLATGIKVERDDLIGYVGIQTLYERYFVRADGEVLETPQAFWMRVAMGLAINEEDRSRRALEFYEVLSSLRFVASTPTLFHSGLTHPQLSSCYLSTVKDDLTHIFKCIGDNAQMSKWSGGIGNDWTSIRGTGSHIHSTHVESQGVIPFLKIANDTTVAINRSGKRRGATCAYLETWHLDIEDFVDLRRNTGDERRRTHDMNTANWIPDLFMKRVKQEGMWTLFSPDEVPDLHETFGAKFEERYLHYEREAEAGRIKMYKRVEAVKLWRKMLTRLFETGHPWITFKDPSNVRSPQDHAGVVHNSNLCTEITLNNSADETAVCNLGSVNLARHVSREGIDHELIADTVGTALRMLDNVIDINFYPTVEAERSNMRHRPVGLGLMGFQDALFTMRIPFYSDRAIAFADESMELISYHAIFSSSKLAVERGTYESYRGSKWDRGLFPVDTVELLEQERGVPIDVPRGSKLDWNEVREHVATHGMRNSNTMAVAPTATISNIAGCYPCIEPIYKNLYVKSNMSGEFTIVNKYLVRDLKARGLWNQEMLDQLKFHDGSLEKIENIPAELKNLYKEAFEIDPVHLIKITAARGKWIDQSQSHNVFMRGASGKKLHDIYTAAWECGLKTTYYLRTLGASQIEKSTLDAKKYGYTQKRDQSGTAAANAGATPDLVGGDGSIAPSDPPGTTTSVANPAPAPGAIKAVDVPATQVGDACSVLDPDCESCQ